MQTKMTPMMRWIVVFSTIVAAMTLGCDQQVKSADRVVQHVCRSNLQKLYVALQQYAAKNQGSLPAEWRTLVESGVLTVPSGDGAVNPLVCAGSPIEASRLPSSKQEWLDWIQRGDVSYVLVASEQTLTPQSRTVIVVEKPGNHLDGGFVLLSDGSIEQRNENDIRKYAPR